MSCLVSKKKRKNNKVDTNTLLKRVLQYFFSTFLLDGNTEHVTHVWEKTEDLDDLNKCLKMIKLPIILYTWDQIF